MSRRQHRLSSPVWLAAAKLRGSSLAQEFAKYRLSSLSPSLAAFLPHLTARQEVKRVDKQTGEEEVVAEQRRNFWEQYGSKEYPLLAKACSPHAEHAFNHMLIRAQLVAVWQYLLQGSRSPCCGTS
jgi:hypothetical protein